jgi:sarcosine oxidase
VSRTAIVVGGGVIGSAAAWRLAVRGLDVTLLEQFEPGHTLGSSYGSSRIFRLAYPDTLYTSLALSALGLWRELEEESGSEVLTLTGGVDHGPEHALQPLRDSLAAVGQASGTLDPTEAAGCAGVRVAGLWYALSVVAAAVRWPCRPGSGGAPGS